MSISWIIILIFLTFLLFGTSGPAAVTGDIIEVATIEAAPAASRVEIDGNPGVILDASSYMGGFESWTPTDEELQAAEDAVLPAVVGERKPVMEGYRQYVGIVVDGERQIVINSMCSETAGWTEEFIMTMDGGPCFWNALYNVDTAEMESVIVNGDA